MPRRSTVAEHQSLEDADEPGGMPPAPEGSAGRVEGDAPDVFETIGQQLLNAGRAFVTTYDADGEAIDVPLETPAPAEDLFLQPTEIHDGKEVTQWQLRYGGKTTVGRVHFEDRAFWEGLTYGRKGWALISYEVDGDGHAPVKKDGDVVGLSRFKKVKIGTCQPYAGQAPEPAEEPFDRGLLEQVAGVLETVADTDNIYEIRDTVSAAIRDIWRVMGVDSPEETDDDEPETDLEPSALDAALEEAGVSRASGTN